MQGVNRNSSQEPEFRDGGKVITRGTGLDIPVQALGVKAAVGCNVGVIAVLNEEESALEDWESG